MFRAKLVLLTVMVATITASVGTAFAGNGTPVNTGSANALTMAVYGDSPYGTSNADTAQFDATPAFVESINADPKVDLVAHVGDIHSGKQDCSLAYDQSVFALWQQFKDPLVYTPGDNEWTDCHKAAEGGGDPIANLGFVRQTFFANPGYTLGGRKKQVLSQAQHFDAVNHPTDGNYVENVLWEQSQTLFVTINLPGGSNNDTDPWFGNPITQAQTDEVAQRTGADLRWLDFAFAQAEADHVDGVVILAQADMWDPEKGAAHQANYEDIISNIAANTTAFGKSVLMFNGDSHVYRSDNPLVQHAPCATESGACTDDAWDMHPSYDVPNFHRIVVHGSTAPMEWLRLTVDPRADNAPGPDAFGIFSWQRMTQPLP